MRYNGEPLKLEKCLDSNEKQGVASNDCFFNDFLSHMDDISVNGDLDALCS